MIHLNLLKQANELISEFIKYQEAKQKKAKADYCVILDAGHGGLNPEGRYVTAPSKQWRHSHNDFHQDGWFQEGVFNRHLLTKIAGHLINEGINFEVVSHEWKDTPRHTRVHRVNSITERYKGRTWCKSIHSNASGSHTARGWSVWTAKGQSKSDKIADLLWRAVDGTGLHMRSERWGDGDHDYEANFDMVYRTKCPAVLTENGFFDNDKDASWLFDDTNQDKLAKATVEGIKAANEYLF